MRKKHLYTALIVTCLALSLCACNKANEAVNTETPISTSEPTPEPTEIPTSVPTEIPTSVPDDSEVSGNQPTGNQTNIGNNIPEDNNDKSTTDNDVTEEVPSISDIPVAPDNSENDNNETVDKSDAEKFPEIEPTKGPDEPTAAPTPTEKPEVTVTPTPGVTEKPEEPSVSPTPTVTPEPTKEPTKAPTQAPTATPTPEPTPTTKPVTPTPTPGSDKDDKPATSTKVENEAGYGKGKDITLDTVNVSIPTLDKFNSFGVDESGKGWVSTTGEGEEVLGETLTNVRYALIDNKVINSHSQAFYYSNYCISWSYLTGIGAENSTMALERDPNSDTYTLTINASLKKYELMGVDYAKYNQDIVLVLCSLVSSEPQLLFETLFEDLTGDVCISDTSYTPVGDCKVKFEADDSANGHYVYTIKAK